MAWFLFKIIIQVILEEGGWVEFHHLGREIQIKIFFLVIVEETINFSIYPLSLLPHTTPLPHA